MPLYEIHASTPLTKAQRDELAQTITQIHTRKFVTPSLFVNIRFLDTSAEHNYIGGKPRATNRIVAYVRSGGPRTSEDFEDLALQVQGAWDRIVVRAERCKETELNRVFVMGAIAAGVENGVLLPRAGGDVDWLRENLPRFEERARRGDRDFIDLVEEMRDRVDLAG
ncbi:uncharacterized protein BJX67DRAFT_355976 [Aspergillus lucknowensis]|uniref:Tautomerase cis-CaaD-like domain-containing protein n=1 Tax=Aspergillus lucknowensis TaxID=176173 RepID=A0ABR4LNU7_9EURO